MSSFAAWRTSNNGVWDPVIPTEAVGIGMSGQVDTTGAIDVE